jgi:hypothetical protein
LFGCNFAFAAPGLDRQRRKAAYALSTDFVAYRSEKAENPQNGGRVFVHTNAGTIKAPLLNFLQCPKAWRTTHEYSGPLWAIGNILFIGS